MRIRKLFPLAVTAVMLLVTGCGKDQTSAELGAVCSMELKYAEQFTVDYRDDGCSVVTIGDDSFLVVPEDTAVPADSAGMTVIKQPVENIYVAASSAMDLFDGIGQLDRVTMTSTTSASWSLPAIRGAVESGGIEYIGKYSSPDYEYLVAENCGLAVESTMIYHTPRSGRSLKHWAYPC